MVFLFPSWQGSGRGALGRGAVQLLGACALKSVLLDLVFQEKEDVFEKGSYHKRQKPQAPTPQAPIRNRQTRKVANAKRLNRNTNLA